MKKFFIGLFTVITIIPVLAYFAACFTPFISPVSFWPMAFLALGFPYLALVILILAFAWFFIRKKIAFFLIILFFVGFKNLFATFALNPPPQQNLVKDKSCLRVLTWNVRGFDNPAPTDSVNSIRSQMFSYIKKVNPDVLCLQEFSEHAITGALSNTETLKKLGYIFFFRTNERPHYYSYGIVLDGTAIFSKVPFDNPQEVMLGDTSYREYLASVDVTLNTRKIRIFASHFKSINLFANPADTLNRVIFYGDNKFVYKASKFEKLKAFGQAHTKEALIAKAALNKTPYPIVLGTDMNSVPTSYAYHTMSSGLQDAFKLNGWGLGTTLDSLPKTLRIDFLLIDKRLDIKNYQKDELHLSDHFPQFIDVAWKQ